MSDEKAENKAEEKAPPTPDELPPTPLVNLVARAKEALAPKEDRHGPAAIKAMAAVVRDLAGMPGLIVTRETQTRLKLARKGKVGFVTLWYDAAVVTMHVEVGGFYEGREPGSPKSDRYLLQGTTWHRMDGEGELFADLRTHLVRIYPELA
jgi:hypothetical protein